MGSGLYRLNSVINAKLDFGGLFLIKHRSLAKLIILSFITFGIYGIIFWWDYVNDINDVCVCDGKKSPNYIVVILLSVITFGIYHLIWIYQQGERLKYIAPEYGLDIKQGGKSVLLYSLGGSLVMNFASFIMNIIIILYITIVDISLLYSFLAVIFPPMAGPIQIILQSGLIRKMQSILPLDLTMFYIFCCITVYFLGICLVFKSINILIVNLNKISDVYNEKCI